ncbi:cytochrome P450 [Peniophora sp. CONT]|nr:cytochrome P450 [Peniophora sp. CONT]
MTLDIVPSNVDTFIKPSISTLGIAAGLVLILVVRYLKSPWRKVPPSPRGLPIIGNALQLGGKKWLTFSNWRKEYGDIIYLNAAGQSMVVLNSHRIATDLLDRRAGNYSDRPPSYVACEILCSGLLLPLVRYNETWRRMRKAAHEALNKVVAHGLREYQTEEALVLARNGLQSAAVWDKHVRCSAASLMLCSVYDEPPVTNELDARVSHINEFANRVTHACSPGAYWVELLPWMRYIPSKFASWKRTAEEHSSRDSEVLRRFYDRVQKSVDGGNERASLCATLIHDIDRHGLSAQENSWLATSLYEAGADTTRAVLSWWTLAMLAYPEVQQRAQDELDTVVGRARVPTFADMPNLPYISAMVKEIIRWRPVTPFAVPHTSLEDDFYEGYFIPKGTAVLANVWELNHDPEIFGSDAHTFNPARYLDKKSGTVCNPPGTRDDGHFTFGFGRRICVGRHVANNSLFIDMATCLWAFSFANVHGQELDVDDCIDEGIVVAPKPFKVDVQPRFPEVHTLLSQECELHGR